MAAAKKKSSHITKNTTGSSEDVQARMDEQTEKGYRGQVPDPYPNSAYSLASGPDSPTARDGLEAGKAGAAALTGESAEEK